MPNAIPFAVSVVGSESSALIRSVPSCVRFLSPITKEVVNGGLNAWVGGLTVPVLDQRSDPRWDGQSVRTEVLRSMCRSRVLGAEDEEEVDGRVGLTFRAERTFLLCLPCQARGSVSVSYYS